MAARFSGPGLPYHGLAQITPSGPRWTGEVRLVEERLGDPLRWQRPRMIFANSMSDLFHEKLSDEQIAAVFGVMAASPRHTFQVLTKRPERMLAFLRRAEQDDDPLAFLQAEGGGWWPGGGNWPGAAEDEGNDAILDRLESVLEADWPLPNVWLGTSVEDQPAADKRAEILRQTPAAMRFLSCEPLLGAVDLDPWLWEKSFLAVDPRGVTTGEIDWVIAGGESGPGARPMHPDWARQLRDQCQAAGVPFFFKQWGRWVPGMRDEFRRRPSVMLGADGAVSEAEDAETLLPFCRAHRHSYPLYDVGKHASGRMLDGKTWDEFPTSTKGA